MASAQLKAVAAKLRPLGIVIRKTEDDEYRVNFAGGHEDTAYYGRDLDDALDTGRAMAKEGNRHKAESMRAREAVHALMEGANPAELGDAIVDSMLAARGY